MNIVILPLDRHRYAPLVHGWLSHPASAFWQLDELSLDDVRAYLAAVAADPRQESWLGFVDSEPTFLVETYEPAVVLSGVPEVQAGDLGMHLLVGPPDGRSVHGLTSAVMAATVAFCFDELSATRVVVEPDVRNARIAAKNAEVGFRVLREIDLPGKRASLAVCTREAFAASGARGRTGTPDAELTGRDSRVRAGSDGARATSDSGAWAAADTRTTDPSRVRTVADAARPASAVRATVDDVAAPRVPPVPTTAGSRR